MITDRDNRNDCEHTKHGRPEFDRYASLRNVLNFLFMIGALTGVGLYYFKNPDTGIIVILVSMLFKIVECVFRFIK